MSENLPAPAQADPANLAEETIPDAANPATAGEPAQGAEPAPQGDTPKPSPWYQRRIAEEAQRRREAEAELTALRAAQLAAEEQPTQVDPNEFRKAVQVEAARLAQQQMVQAQAQRIFQDGKREFGDYEQTVRALTDTMGDATQSPAFLETVFDMPNGAHVIYALGKNLDAAQEILSLPPLKMARRLEQFAGTLTKPTTPSAPAIPDPIRPVARSSGASSGPKDTWTAADWDKYYSEKRRARYGLT